MYGRIPYIWPSPVTDLTAIRSGNDIVLNWSETQNTSAYNIYSDTDPTGSFATSEATVYLPITSWTDGGAVSAGVKKFYIVKSDK